MPPEFLKFGWYDACHSTVWALGMTLVEMMSPLMAFDKPELALTRPPRIPKHISAGIASPLNEETGVDW